MILDFGSADGHFVALNVHLKRVIIFILNKVIDFLYDNKIEKNWKKRGTEKGEGNKYTTDTCPWCSLTQKCVCVCVMHVCASTHTLDHTGRISRRSFGSSRMDTSCRTDARGGHMAGSCTPDWISYLKR